MSKKSIMYCTDCSQEQFLKCGELDSVEASPCKLIGMLKSIFEEQNNDFKVVIMRIDEKTKEWYLFVYKTEFFIDVGADCCLSNISLANVLDVLARYNIAVEIRYDYFR